ncbi:uncharacterized protein THITE_2079458 [Thermothielavioides terrestris NRRL 8126]|uniref:RNA-dependent RNA polymerase n=1 Tax=Thermothielavioides terrestris (strain ATCC 38088 / NRRL 8126) TaxID=578455 RepID=G2R911_THETT|nr:uncharacterized protein THITE_2079458 [Thermothielavioides terrestris NRRL 8126]AEO68606.1 hypothetical protein THITE_2079458 [Thermothielavioides terrestris NRRL 8126]
MGSAAGSAFLATPSRTASAVDKVIQQLNDDYGLGLRIPDPALSPSRHNQLAEQDEQYAQWLRIFRGIKFLYYQRGDSLEQALDSFFLEARAASRRWVPKPRADPGTLPSPRSAPKAQTPDQQWNLQTILVSVLDRFKAQSRAPPLALSAVSGRAGARGPPQLPAPAEESDPGSLPESPASTGSKRSSDGALGLDAKRWKGQPPARSPSPTPTVLSNALDNVPSRRRLGFPPMDWSPQRQRLDAERSISSDTSGSSKVSSLFSRLDSQRSTQTTSDGEEREQKHGPTVIVSSLSQQGLSAATNNTVPPPTRTARPVTGGASRAPPRSSAAGTLYSDLSHVAWDDSVAEIPGSGRNEADALPIHPEVYARLQNIWPKFPRWLHAAPLALAWELTRICLHCKVDLEDPTLRYDPSWATSDMAALWRSLTQLDVFRGKSFPERPSAEAFAAALTGNFESRGNTVVLSASLEFNPSKTGPLFLLDMKPLRFDEGCRLTRRFGPDRFLEVLVPSPTALNAPSILKDGGAAQVIRWLTEKPHSLVGRQWQAFYTKDAGYRKPARELRLGPDAKATFKERVHFFAERGHDFRPAPLRTRAQLPPESPSRRRTEIRVSEMLDWLLQLEQNEYQPHLKLFSRIQLGLSKTFPTVTFEPNQIRHRTDDILSPAGKIMNDGIGRMSRSVARKIRDALGLSDIPSAIQGRMGSAKGMWLMDVADAGDDDWIETYPSQRKWKCDDADALHRTLEIRSVSTELKPAALNLQFLPVLEDRAKDKARMRRAIAARLMNDLKKQFDSQKAAVERPLQFRQWVNECTNSRSERVRHGQVPFLGGLPENKGEVLSFLLNSGFDRRQKYIQDLAFDLQKQRCEVLRTKLNIHVGRSAYMFMVVDFWGVLEENEVHVGFSSKFRDDVDDTTYMLLTDCDVLVARSPAHFPSDIQKVRAVFKPQLHALKDVIVFPAKGDIPLADKLSGGDYDGDMAWVCWDPDIVENFTNADMPKEPDLSAYLGKDKTTFGELVRDTGRTGAAARHEAVYDMINKSFQFAMQPNYLGICTNYKERVCYHNNSVSDGVALLLSTLVGKLVDQSKQGILFDAASWDRLRRERLGGRMSVEDPAYKGDVWAGAGEPRHIVDYLKFAVAKPTIDRELEELHKVMQASRRAGPDDDAAAHSWDPDLAVYFENFKALTAESRSLRAVLEALQNALGAVEHEWKVLMSKGSSSSLTYPEKVRQLHAKWCAIEPRAVGRAGSNRLDAKTAALLEQPFLADRGGAGTSYWALLRASTAFKAYYKTNPKFVWQMAGAQLAFIKAQMSSPGGGGGGGSDGMPLLVTPLMYAGLAPDGRFVKQYLARLECDGSQYPDDDLEGDGEDGGGGGGRGDDVD